MARVFVSHSTNDRPVVDGVIVPLLQQAGLETWYSKDDIKPAQNFQQEIVQGLEKCQWFLLVMTPEASLSPWVRAELNWAIDNRRGRIVPVLLKDCEALSFHLQLPPIQHVDFRENTRDSREQLLWAFQLEPPAVENDGATELNKLKKNPAPPVNLIEPPKTHFHCGPWVPAEFFIGRERELTEARHLVESGQSFLIIGQPRAGKTSFCKKLLREYEANQPEILVSYINLQQYSDLTIETFLEVTMIDMVGEIARKVFGCRYFDLKREDPAAAYPDLQHDRLFAHFVDVYRHISTHTHDKTNAPANPLTTRDFIQLTRELLEIAAERDRQRFLVFYDEANRLPVDISGNLLVSIGETLSETGVTGGYVASPEMEHGFDKLDQLFGAKLKVGPFRTPEEMKQLMARYYFNDIAAVPQLPATRAAMDSLWNLSGGVPFLIQLIANSSFRAAHEQSSRVLEVSHIEAGHAAATKERPAAFKQR